jgi:hypothetical protein
MDAGGSIRHGLSPDQRAGVACLVCDKGGEGMTQVGWIDGEVEAMVHTWCVETWRSGN